VERKTGLPAGGVGVIDAEIVALSLMSIAPANIGGSFFDVFVTINAAPGWGGLATTIPLPPSLGTLTITEHDDGAGGGTFDSFFDVFAELKLVEVGNPSNTILMVIDDGLTSTGTQWFHSAIDPRQGDFVPGPITHTGPHPQSLPADPPFPNQIPEPTSVLLVSGGFVALAAFARRRRAR